MSTTVSNVGTLTPSLIPLLPQPQMLSIALGNATYNLMVKWNPVAQLWVLDIADVNNNPIVGGIPLVTGINLLAQYSYLNIGGSLYVQTTNDPDVTPTFSNLGSQSNLYFVTDTSP